MVSPATVVNVISVSVAIFSVYSAYQFRESRDAAPSADINLSSEPAWELLDHLGGISPWKSNLEAAESTVNILPQQCIVDQVHMMARHGERYPTMSAGIRMLELYHRIKKSGFEMPDDLAFFNDWDFFAPYPDQHFEQLTTTGPHPGSLSAFTAGVQLRTKYSHLLERVLSRGRISFWVSLSQRCIESAQYFAVAFFGIDWTSRATLHIIPETIEQGANAFSPGRSCPNYIHDAEGRGHAHGLSQMEAFISTYTPGVAKRLNQVHANLTFNSIEIFTMQEMCAFELLAKGTSPWCEIFNQSEWESFEYARDILHFYRAGPGNRYGPTLGWLWLNATATLLQQGLDPDPLFLTFNHDGDIVAFLAALDLYPQTPALPTTHILEDRTWRVSNVVPMSGRVILERLVCAATPECWDNGPLYPNHVYCNPAKNETYVRVLVNDKVVPLPACHGGPGESCLVKDFAEHVRRRGEEVGSFAEVCGLAPEVPQYMDILHQ